MSFPTTSMNEISSPCQIGIVTLAGLFNYGNRLQAYATQRVLAARGFKPVTLETTDARLQHRAKVAVKRALGMPVTKEDVMSPNRLAAFQRFNERVSTVQLPMRHIHPEDYACFVSGSDQVWNPNFMKYRHPEMLPFAMPEKRVALAASIGVSRIEPEDHEWFAREVGAFTHISVRERRAAEIVQELTGRYATVVIDPTLAISSSHWRSIASDALTPAGSYVFTYLLGGISDCAQTVLGEVAHGDTPVIALTDRNRPGELPAGPAEFISLVANASHVVTDSFHASIFSLLMGTPLTIVRRVGNTTMFSRLESFAATFGLENCIYEGGAFEPVPIDYARAYEFLVVERQRFSTFLDVALQG